MPVGAAASYAGARPVPAFATPPVAVAPPAPRAAPATTTAPTRERSKAGWVTLGLLLVGLAIAVPVIQATLLDGSSSQGPSRPIISTTTPSTVFTLADLSIACSNGTMRDCDRLYEQLQSEAGSGDPSMESTAETCGMADPAGGHQGTCEEQLGSYVPGTVPTTAGP